VAKRALVIANSVYDDGRFAALPAAAADAAALTDVLSDPAIGAFAVDRMVDVGQRAATRAIESFFLNANPEDLLVLHLSLHGWKDLRNRLYFVARDTERDFPRATAISADFVGDCMSLSKSRRMVLLLDCCYSGAFTAGMMRRSGETPEVDVAEPFDGKGRMVITASNALQFAHEAEPDVRFSRSQAQPSLFTSAVVGGLKDGSADLDGDGLISVNELYEYVLARVRDKVPGQTPTLTVDTAQGTIYLARNPGSVDSDALAQLREAAAGDQAWKRIGALHLIERLLASVREPVRDAARSALLGLIRDDDPQVAQRARRLWHERGLGDIPAPARARRVQPRRTTDGAFVAGIDFGTTNSAIGVFADGEVQMVPNAEGSLMTPSVVALTPDGPPLVGAAAKRQAISNPQYTVASVKLKLGSDWTIERGGITHSAEEIAALILSRLRADAEAYTGGALFGAVITVPAYFGHTRRYALLQAAQMAGINVLRIINEPTAASITYGLNREGEQTVLVLDLGGGTFDVSLLEIGEPSSTRTDDVSVCYVRATAGDNHLGGDTWDQQLADHLRSLVRQRHGVDVSRDAAAMQRLVEAAEAAKVELSSAQATDIRLPYLAATRAGPVHLDMTLTRAEFEALTRSTLERCQIPIEQVLHDSGVRKSDIDHVILVGGSTRMPAVGEFARRVTGGAKLYRGLIPEGIVTGAAIQGAVLKGQVKNLLLLDVTPMSLGIETKKGEFSKIIERNTTIPTKRSEVFSTGIDNQETVTLHLLEGERESAGDNRPLAVFELTGLSSAPRRTAQIEVTIDIDANGVLVVSAKDLGTGREKSITVSRDSAAEATQLTQSARWSYLRKNLPAEFAADRTGGDKEKRSGRKA
jgi:molecular chaperone DnaK